LGITEVCGGNGIQSAAARRSDFAHWAAHCFFYHRNSPALRDAANRKFIAGDRLKQIAQDGLKQEWSLWVSEKIEDYCWS